MFAGNVFTTAQCIDEALDSVSIPLANHTTAI